MGTNYYVRPAPCERPCIHCQAPETIHLGKSSGGWAFMFRAYPEIGDTGRSEIGPVVSDFASWTALVHLGTIETEYGEPLAIDDLLKMIEDDRGKRRSLGGGDFADADGNRFTPADFC